MRRWFVMPAALMFAGAQASQAAPLDAGLQQQLMAVYDGYNKAIAAGKLPDALDCAARRRAPMHQRR